ncbi:MAG: radical SAM protein [Pseudomonadota bacterium]
MRFTVGLEITRRCNFKCRHCFVDAGRPRDDEMDTAEAGALIRDLAACGVDTLGWSGGEPLLRDDLDALTWLASRCGMAVGLASNGLLASAERLRALRINGLGVLQVSLDGVTAEAARRLRVGPSRAYERAIEAAQEGMRQGLETYLCTLLAPETAGEIEPMIALARQLGVTGLRYTLWAPVGRAAGQGYDEQAWSSEQVRRFFEVVAREQTRPGLDLIVDCPTGAYPGHSMFRCHAGQRMAYITAVGDVYPCTALMFPDYLAGNTRTRLVHEILFGEAMQRVQRELAAQLPGGACAGCESIASCRGGCPGRTVATRGTLHDTDGARLGEPACLWRLLEHSGPV